MTYLVGFGLILAVGEVSDIIMFAFEPGEIMQIFFIICIPNRLLESQPIETNSQFLQQHTPLNNEVTACAIHYGNGLLAWLKPDHNAFANIT